MFASLGSWREPDQLRHRLEQSAVFRERLHGPMRAVRQVWGLPPEGSGSPVWSSAILQVPAEVLRGGLAAESHVYLTHVNTPAEVVVSGLPDEVARVARRLETQAFPLPLELALHCDIVRSEQAAVRRCSTCLSPVPDVTFWSSGYYGRVPHDSSAIAQSLAEGLCHPVDFPRLVEAVYASGARVFLELGARQICSTWIGTILASRPHLALPVNQKGVDDRVALLRALARLLSHRLPFDPSPLLPAAAPASVLVPSNTDRADIPPRADLEAVRPSGRSGPMLTYLRSLLAAILEVSPDTIDPRQPLPRLGISSLMGLHLKLQLEADLHVELPVTDLFEVTDLAELAESPGRRLGSRCRFRAVSGAAPGACELGGRVRTGPERSPQTGPPRSAGPAVGRTPDRRHGVPGVPSCWPSFCGRPKRG